MNNERQPRQHGESRTCSNRSAHEMGHRFGARAAQADWQSDQADTAEIAPRRYRERRHEDARGNNECTSRGHAAGRAAREAWRTGAHEGRRHHRGGGHRMHSPLAMVMAKLEQMEERIEQLQHQLAAEQKPSHGVTRTRRESGGGHRYGYRHAAEIGRKMGSMSRPAWRERQSEA